MDLLLFFQGIPTSYNDKVSKSLYLNQSIEQDLIYNKAKTTSFLVTSNEAKNQLETILSKSKRNIDDFKKTLVNKSFTYNDIINQFAKQLTINAYINSTVLSKITISNKEQLDYYNQNKPDDWKPIYKLDRVEGGFCIDVEKFKREVFKKNASVPFLSRHCFVQRKL